MPESGGNEKVHVVSVVETSDGQLRLARTIHVFGNLYNVLESKSMYKYVLDLWQNQKQKGK